MNTEKKKTVIFSIGLFKFPINFQNKQQVSAFWAIMGVFFYALNEKYGQFSNIFFSFDERRR